MSMRSNLRAFLTRIGADLAAKYVYFICNDDFAESIDMASALHPQTILATKYAGSPITDPFGCAPRSSSATRAPNGSRQSKSPTRFAPRSGASRAKTGSLGFDLECRPQAGLYAVASGDLVATASLPSSRPSVTLHFRQERLLSLMAREYHSGSPKG